MFTKNGTFYDYCPAACLRVTGEDALSFLQGQFTQELRPDRAPPVTYGLWLNQKGRVLADSYALRISEQEVWLFSLGSPAKTLCERLEAYVIADDVTIEDVTAHWRGRTFFGRVSEEWWRAAAPDHAGLPAKGEWIRVGTGFVFRTRRGVDDAWEWLSLEPAPLPPDGWEAFAKEDVEYLRIAARIPSVPEDAGPGDLPNEAGLEAEAISFTKGCYLGQEVMARLKSMGRVRRRLLKVVASQMLAPTLPAALFQDDRKVGELRSLAPRPDGGVVGLAMGTLQALDSARALSLVPSGDAAFTLMEAPG